jgi:hypothetical protein
MQVILTDTKKGESYKFTLDDKYIKGDESEYVLPGGDGFQFYSSGYVFRLIEHLWSEFDDPPPELVERVMTELQKQRN